jgi:hypothetical protein
MAVAVVVIEVVVPLGETLVNTAIVLSEPFVIAPEVSSAILGKIFTVHVWSITHALRPISAHGVRPVSAHGMRTISAHGVRPISSATSAAARMGDQSKVCLVSWKCW